MKKRPGTPLSQCAEIMFLTFNDFFSEIQPIPPLECISLKLIQELTDGKTV